MYKIVHGELEVILLQRNIVGLSGISEHPPKVCGHEFKVKLVSWVE